MNDTTALVVIDLQRGAFDGVRWQPIDGADTLIDRATALVGAARAAGVPVLFVRHCEGAGALFEDGAPQGELHEALAPQVGEPVVKKRASSAFENTDLQALLDYVGARRLVLCGLQSEFCITNTANAALDLGYGVTIAADAHGTWSTDAEPAAAISARVNDTLQARGAALQNTEALVQSGLGRR